MAGHPTGFFSCIPSLLPFSFLRQGLIIAQEVPHLAGSWVTYPTLGAQSLCQLSPKLDWDQLQLSDSWADLAGDLRSPRWTGTALMAQTSTCAPAPLRWCGERPTRGTCDMWPLSSACSTFAACRSLPGGVPVAEVTQVTHF
jgi:hypothetical protein